MAFERVEYVVVASEGGTPFLPVAKPGTGGREGVAFAQREDAEQYAAAAQKRYRKSLTYAIQEKTL